MHDGIQHQIQRDAALHGALGTLHAISEPAHVAAGPAVAAAIRAAGVKIAAAVAAGVNTAIAVAADCHRILCVKIACPAVRIAIYFAALPSAVLEVTLAIADATATVLAGLLREPP